MFEFRDEVGAPFFEVSQFLSLTFNEDFSYEYPDEATAVGDFASRADPTTRSMVVRELQQLVDQLPTEDGLAHALHVLGANYIPQGTGATYREFVLRIRGWLVESLVVYPPEPGGSGDVAGSSDTGH
jgi:CdiI immunity protein